MRVNEKSTITITVRPFDEDGNALTPGTARYRLDDLTSQTEIIAWTAIATPSTEMEVVIPASANAIIDGNLGYESKVLTVSTDYSTSAEHNDEIVYEVKNLHFIT